jgi:hypothetical protein
MSYEIEVNDSFVSANLINAAEKVIGQLSSSSDKDYFKFRVATPGLISVSIQPPSNAGAYPGYTYSVYSPEQVLLGSGYGNASQGYIPAAAIASAAGVYFLEVSAFLRVAPTGLYELTISAGQFPAPSPTYALSADTTSVNEGQTANFTLQTQNVPSGTKIYYTVFSVSAADVVGGQLTGSVTVGANGQAKISIPLAMDSVSESTEVLRLQTSTNLSISPDDQSARVASINVLDTSTTPVIVSLVNNGRLNSSVVFLDTLTSVYTDLTYAQRLSQTLNALTDFDRNVISDFRSGGNINSFVNGSVTTVILDNYRVEMTGRLGANSSLLSQYKITHLTSGDSVTYSGNLSYNSFPMYAGTYLIPGSTISKIAWSSGENISWLEGAVILQSDFLTFIGTLSKATGAKLVSGRIDNGEFYGQITDLDVKGSYNLSTGNTSFTGSATRQTVGIENTSLAQLRASGTFNPSDYITMDRISADVNSRSVFDFYAGNNLVNLSSPVGTVFYAGSGDDTITGSEVGDSIAGEAGNDFLDGRGGNDTAIYTGSYNQYSFSKNGNSYTVADSVGSREGVDTLSNIEFVKFSNKTVAVSDLISQSSSGEVSVSGTSTNSAGKNETVVGSTQIDKFVYEASASSYQVNYSSGRVTVRTFSGEEDSLTNIERLKFIDKSMAFDIAGNAGKAYRVYKAAFARDPQSGDMSGLGFWISRIDNGMDMVEVAARFIDSPEFRTLYGQNPSNADFLTKVYTNVLGRAPDQGGYSWWLNELNTNPTKTKAKVLADFAESGENQAGVASLIGNGIQYTEFVG